MRRLSFALGAALALSAVLLWPKSHDPGLAAGPPLVAEIVLAHEDPPATPAVGQSSLILADITARSTSIRSMSFQEAYRPVQESGQPQSFPEPLPRYLC